MNSIKSALDKFTGGLNRLFLGVMFLFLGIQLYMAFTGGSSNYANHVYLITGGFVYIILGLKIKKFIDKKELKTNTAAYLAAAVYFVLLVLSALFLTVTAFYDLNNIQQEAVSMMNHDTSMLGGKDSFSGSSYYSTYSNQIPSTMLLYYMYKIGYLFGSRDYMLTGSIFNSLGLALTALAVYFIVKLKFKRSTALWTMLMFIVNPMFYVYASYSYTDTLSMPWALWGNYFFLKAFIGREDKKFKVRDFIFALLGAFLMFIGFKIRATGIIVVVALTFCILVYHFGKKRLLLAMLIPGFLAVSLMVGSVSDYLGFDVDKDVELPPFHFIVMGTYEPRNGWFMGELVKYSADIPGYDNKVDAELEHIKRNLEYMGPTGFINLIRVKWRYIWAEGNAKSSTFKSMREGGTVYDYAIGDNAVYYNHLVQVNRIGILFFMLAATAGDFLTKKKKMNPWLLTYFGGVLFYFFWETHNRYSLCFTPWMVMLMPVAEAYISSLSERAKEKFTDGYAKRGLQAVAIVLIAMTGMMLLRSYNEFSRDPSVHDDVIIYQVGDDPRLSSLDRNRYVQTFSTSNDFNVLGFAFKKDTDEGKFSIELKQADKYIAKKVFEPSELIEESKLEWVLPVTCHPDSKTEYTLIINALDYVKPDEVPEQEDFMDVSPDRTLSINDVPVNSDIQLMAYNRTERVTIPKPVFFTSVVIYIGLEIFCVKELWALRPRKKAGKEAVSA